MSIEEDDDGKIRRNLLVVSAAIVAMRFLGIKQDFFVLVLKGLSEEAGKAAEGIAPWKFTLLAGLTLCYLCIRFWHTDLAGQGRRRATELRGHSYAMCLQRRFSVVEKGDRSLAVTPRTLQPAVEAAAKKLDAAIPRMHWGEDVVFTYDLELGPESPHWKRREVLLVLTRSIGEPQLGRFPDNTQRSDSFRAPLSTLELATLRVKSWVEKEWQLFRLENLPVYRIPVWMAALATLCVAEKAVLQVWAAWG